GGRRGQLAWMGLSGGASGSNEANGTLSPAVAGGRGHCRFSPFGNGWWSPRRRVSGDVRPGAEWQRSHRFPPFADGGPLRLSGRGLICFDVRKRQGESPLSACPASSILSDGSSRAESSLGAGRRLSMPVWRMVLRVRGCVPALSSYGR